MVALSGATVSTPPLPRLHRTSFLSAPAAVWALIPTIHRGGPQRGWDSRQATSFQGSGLGLTSLNASQLTGGTVPLAQLSGAVVTNNESGVNLNGTFSGNGAGLTSLNAQFLNGKTSSNFVAKAGDTMIGTLNLPANGLVVGTNQLVLSSGNVGIGTNAPRATLDVNGTTRTKVLSITGGADVAEPFAMSGADIPKGAVVVIDDAHPGHFKLSDRRMTNVWRAS